MSWRAPVSDGHGMDDVVAWMLALGAVRRCGGLFGHCRSSGGKGFEHRRIASIRNSFWSASVHRATELAVAMATLEAKGLCMDRIASMCDSFWSASVNRPPNWLRP